MIPTEPTPLSVRPLHDFSGTFGGGSWIACSQPERPADEGTKFDFRCRACWLSAKAALLQGYELPGILNFHTGAQMTSLAEMVAVAAHLHERNAS